MNKSAQAPRTPSGQPAWFPKKKIGYGWGFPITWQGWMVFSGYVSLSILGAIFLTEPPHRIPFFLMYFLPLTLLFIYICWKKGEKLGD